jgi:16S rRNA (cytosine967-C5)-methyltransferase
MEKLLGDEVDVASAAFAQPASMSIRVNTQRGTREQLLDVLRGEAADAHVAASPLAPEALLAEGLGAPGSSASFRDGLWTVQDVAAQLVAHLIAPTAGMRILDACAGVGGKSTHLLQLSGDQAEVEAIDVSGDKLESGRKAADRLGLRNLTSRIADVTVVALEQAAYDAVLLDAPCTGLGVLRRHPEAKWRVRSGDVARMATLQASLLDNCAGAVKPGGTLVYSVCTFTPQEGVKQVEAFLASHPEFTVDTPPVGQVPWDRVADGAYIETWPHRHDADGFFAVRLLRRP